MKKSANDNRNYQFAPEATSAREEYACIADWIPSGSSVIDLGAGDGSLLALLAQKGVRGEGVEISASGVAAMKKKGLKARVGRIDEPLAGFSDQQFDYAISNVTLQMVMYPEVLLGEMKRIARYQILSFPNFAFLPNRLDLFVHGRMPRVMIPGYTWYSTGHIHQLSIRDYEELCREFDLKIIDTHHLGPAALRLKWVTLPQAIMKRFPNLWASTAIFLTTDRSPKKEPGQ